MSRNWNLPVHACKQTGGHSFFFLHLFACKLADTNQGMAPSKKEEDQSAVATPCRGASSVGQVPTGAADSSQVDGIELDQEEIAALKDMHEMEMAKHTVPFSGPARKACKPIQVDRFLYCVLVHAYNFMHRIPQAMSMCAIQVPDSLGWPDPGFET